MSENRGRERERGNVLDVMSVTLDVSHLEISPLNAEAYSFESNAIQKKQKDKKYTQKKKESRDELFC